MRFKEGVSGNPAGRPKGRGNKVTKDVKKWLLDLFYTHAKTLAKDLKEMKPRERWEVVVRVLPFIVPKLQAMDAKVDLNNLSEEQISTIIEEITNNLNESEDE